MYAEAKKPLIDPSPITKSFIDLITVLRSRTFYMALMHNAVTRHASDENDFIHRKFAMRKQLPIGNVKTDFRESRKLISVLVFYFVFKMHSGNIYLVRGDNVRKFYIRPTRVARFTSGLTSGSFRPLSADFTTEIQTILLHPATLLNTQG